MQGNDTKRRMRTMNLSTRWWLRHRGNIDSQAPVRHQAGEAQRGIWGIKMECKLQRGIPRQAHRRGAGTILLRRRWTWLGEGGEMKMFSNLSGRHPLVKETDGGHFRHRCRDDSCAIIIYKLAGRYFFFLLFLIPIFISYLPVIYFLFCCKLLTFQIGTEPAKPIFSFSLFWPLKVRWKWWPLKLLEIVGHMEFFFFCFSSFLYLVNFSFSTLIWICCFCYFHAMPNTTTGIWNSLRRAGGGVGWFEAGYHEHYHHFPSL